MKSYRIKYEDHFGKHIAWVTEPIISQTLIKGAMDAAPDDPDREDAIDGMYLIQKYLHREDGPAIVDLDDSIKYWYQKGLLHRIGGPAYIDNVGHEWYLEGHSMRFAEYCKRVKSIMSESDYFVMILTYTGETY